MIDGMFDGALDLLERQLLAIWRLDVDRHLLRDLGLHRLGQLPAGHLCERLCIFARRLLVD